MKKVSFFLLIILFPFWAIAQKADDCPAIDTVATRNIDSTYYIVLNNIATNDGGAVKVGYYYRGCNNIAGFPVPALPNSITYDLATMFVMKSDSNGAGLWVVPFEILEISPTSAHRPVEHTWSVNLDQKENVHLIVQSQRIKYKVLGREYGISAFNLLDSAGCSYDYYFKISPNGRLLNNKALKTYGPGDNTEYILGFYTPVRQYDLIKADTNDESLVFSIQSFELSNSLRLFDQLNVPTSYGHRHIVKVNAHFVIQWTSEISRCDITAIVQGNKKYELFLVGSFPRLKKDPQNFDSIVVVDGQVLQTDYSMGGYFITKLNTETGIFSKAEILAECSNVIQNVSSSYDNINPGAVDEDSSFYFAGSFKSKKVLLDGRPVVDFKDTVKSGVFLIKYDFKNQERKAFTLIGTNIDQASKVQYLPNTKQVLVTGSFHEGDAYFINKKVIPTHLNTGNAYVFIMSLDPNSKKVSDYARWNYELKENWLVYTQTKLGTMNNTTTISSMYSDKRNRLHVLGTYSGDLYWDWKNINSGGYITAYAVPYTARISKGNYHTQFSWLTDYIRHDDTSMLAAQDNASYQWYDCSKGVQPIPSETGRRFIPPNKELRYAVRVSNSFCSVLSKCQLLSVASVQDLNHVSIYPNPVENTLHFNHLPIGTDILVFDALGRKIFASHVQQSSFKVNTQEWTSGIYMVQLNHYGKIWTKKVLKN